MYVSIYVCTITDEISNERIHMNLKQWKKGMMPAGSFFFIIDSTYHIGICVPKSPNTIAELFRVSPDRLRQSASV